ncbi:hypothetical protein [Halorarum halophilum]|uniref:hypothetical protein n=1 Tax=Halorarum halophilum TaxID=2743090 RepID=UPI001C4F1500|nr:hypothetical protein [Halobaculum halophilum]
MTDTSSTHDHGDGILTRVLEGSRVVRTLRAPLRDDSRTSRATRWLSTVVRNSSGYRWLTKEPEPEVVVIDLRETWTVGPIVRLLDRLVDRVTPYWRESALKRGLDGSVTLGERAAGTRFGRLLVKLLEPPELPADATDSDEQADSRSAGGRDEKEE